MATNWVMKLEPMIFTVLKTKLVKQFKTKFPKINVTDTNRNSTEPEYPSIMLQQLPFVERGQDLEGSSINAILCSFQIDVYTNTTQTDADTIMSEIIDIFKSMKFTINAFPSFANTSTYFRSTLRVERMIGADDVL